MSRPKKPSIPLHTLERIYSYPVCVSEHISEGIISYTPLLRGSVRCERDYNSTCKNEIRIEKSRLECYEVQRCARAFCFTHLTFPPQNRHAEPCQPSWHTQVPLTQSPLMQLSVSQVVSVVSDDEEEEAAAVTCTTQQISAAHSIGHGTAITPH